MKAILLFLSIVMLLATSGCIIVGHPHRGFHGHGEFFVGPPPPVFVEPDLDVHIHPD